MELVILMAIVLLGVGLFLGGKRGIAMVFAGLALGVLGGTEVSIREHFAGYRSHTTLLSAIAAVIAVTLLFLVLPSSWPRPIPFAVGAILFAVSFYLLRETFKRRSGGLGFR